jgi:Ca2+-binding EF-hand superfamily protein
MSTKEETHKNMGFGFCHSLMSNCFKSGSEEGKGEKFNFESCEQMMKQFCAAKDGKFDFETFRSKIAKHCKGTNKEEDDKENN